MFRLTDGKGETQGEWAGDGVQAGIGEVGAEWSRWRAVLDPPPFSSRPGNRKVDENRR